MAIKALTEALHMDDTIAKVFAWGGVVANENKEEGNFDLDHVAVHGWIEHDASLSRDDIAFGSNSKFSPERWEEVLKIYKEGTLTEEGASGVGPQEVTWESASRARFFRVKQQAERHEAAGKVFAYGIKEAVLSYGESALFMNMLGKDGVAPLEWVRILFEEERFPYAEGWRPPAKLDQNMMNGAISKLVEANEEKGEEAKIAGVGTVVGLTTAVKGLVKSATPSYCTVM
jgi:hypothetical protein